MTDQPWPDIGAPLWYRGLYWRIGIGFVVFLALILTVQVVFLAWIVDRSLGTLPGRSPSKFAEMVAADVGSELTRSRQTNLERYVQHHYAQVSHSFFVLLTDGRLLTNGVLPAPGFAAIHAQRASTANPERLAAASRSGRASDGRRLSLTVSW
jgi:hypothetical protein